MARRAPRNCQRVLKTQVDIIYLWINEAKGKFHLLDKRTGKDAFAIDIEAGLHIKYQNDLFTHRVEADE